MATAGCEIQIENGNFSRIHNAILERLAVTEFTGRELRCLLYLLRMTYGFQRKEYELSLSDWSTGTNISRSHIPETLRRLADRGIIYRTENGNRKPATFGFNKYFEQWNEPTATGKGYGSTHMDTISSGTDVGTTTVPHVGTSNGTDVGTKGGTPLQTTTTRIKDNRKKDKNISSPTPADEGKEPTEQQKWFNAVCVLVGLDYKVITKEQTGQVAQTVGKLRKADYSLDDLRAFWHYWKHDDWRGKQGQWPTLKQLLAEIGKVKMAGVTFGGEMSTNGNGGMMSPVFNGSEK